MILKTQLEKHLPDIINKPVNLNNNVVGIIIKYDTTSGMADIEITDDNIIQEYHKIAGHDIGVISISF